MHIKTTKACRDKLTVRLHIRHLHFKHVVDRTGDIIALRHLGHRRHFGSETLMNLGIDSAQLNIAEHNEIAADFLKIDIDGITFYHALALEPAQALEHGCCRTVHSRA